MNLVLKFAYLVFEKEKTVSTWKYFFNMIMILSYESTEETSTIKNFLFKHNIVLNTYS